MNNHHHHHHHRCALKNELETTMRLEACCRMSGRNGLSRQLGQPTQWQPKMPALGLGPHISANVCRLGAFKFAPFQLLWGAFSARLKDHNKRWQTNNSTRARNNLFDKNLPAPLLLARELILQIALYMRASSSGGGSPEHSGQRSCCARRRRAAATCERPREVAPTAAAAKDESCERARKKER